MTLSQRSRTNTMMRLPRSPQPVKLHARRTVHQGLRAAVSLAALLASPAAQATLDFAVPGEWRPIPAESVVQLAQFALPRTENDVEDAELVVYDFGSDRGSVEANLERWTDQMLQPDGRPSADVATTTTFEIDDMRVTVLDVPGIFGAEVQPGSGMRYFKRGFLLKAAVVETQDTRYVFRLTGPERTVRRWEPAFATLLESITLG